MRFRLSVFNWISLILGMSFLYLPILLLIVFSFNESKLVTVWGGFSTKWYSAVWGNESIKDAAWITLKVALISSTCSVLLGTMAALSLNKLGRFRGKTLFSGMVFAPMVMPEVITGLSLLLTFVALGIDRSMLTLIIAHVTFTMCYVTVVVQSRLAGFDGSLEEAAMDLGANHWRTFIYVTLPIILPGIVSGWLLSFTLSLDDLVITSFTTGTSATTLPMRIFSQVKLGVTPEINAICTMLIGVVATAVLITTWFQRKAEKQRLIDERNMYLEEEQE